MDVLCFDIGSGGIAAARFNENLDSTFVGEIPWEIRRNDEGRAVLSALDLESAFRHLAQSLHGSAPVAALGITGFMHSFMVMDAAGSPCTPIHTWLDTASGVDGVERLRRQFGGGFHARTGAHYHPMFPVFKVASIPLAAGDQVVSPKAFLLRMLTGECLEDYGTAGASGMLNVVSGAWDDEILSAIGLQRENLPALVNPRDVVGKVTPEASARFGVRPGTRIIAGSGDGFFANVGSGCTTPARLAVTLGTSAGARQLVTSPVLDPAAGTFCYRASTRDFLLGCAGSNGGNALDWARRVFGPALTHIAPDADIPIFLPWLNGERSLEWDPALRASWHGLTGNHGNVEMIRAVMEAVVFNIARYAEALRNVSGNTPEETVLSGNVFREPAMAPLLAALLPNRTLLPADAGLASLRGAAITAWGALGHDASGAIARLLDRTTPIVPVRDPRLIERYAEFKALVHRMSRREQ